MGPGGYRFGDYWKLGLPLIVLFGAVVDPPRPGLLVVLRRLETLDPPEFRLDRAPPGDERVAALVAEAHERYRANGEGENSQVYPALAAAPRDLFGICVAGTSGRVTTAGDAQAEFAIMSVSKPFVFALVCQALGHDAVRSKLGVNSTGLPFNSLEAVERSEDGRTNPDGQLRRHRRDEPRAGLERRGPLGGHPRRPLPLRRPGLAAQRRGLPLGLGDQPPQPRPRPTAARARAHLLATPPRRSTSTPGSARSTSAPATLR